MYEVALLIMTFQHEVYAEFICATSFEVSTPLNPKLIQAVENVVKRKGYYSKTCFWAWDGEWQHKANVSYARQHYFEIHTLPPTELINQLPSIEFIRRNMEIGEKYREMLVGFEMVVPPWQEDNLSILKQESAEIQKIWSLSWQIHQQKENVVYCRQLLKKLRDELDGDIMLLWSVPPFPTWRLR